MRKYFIYAGLVAAGALSVAAGSSVLAQDDSGPNRVTASLNGFQEGPSIVTTGNGTLDLRIDTETNTIHYELTYSELEGGPAMQAHIHIGSRAENGNVSAFLCGGGSTPPCPGTGGTVSGVITPGDVVGPASQGVEPGSFDELVRAIRAGHTYANVHNERWPGGEIRGQINNDSQRQFER